MPYFQRVWRLVNMVHLEDPEDTRPGRLALRAHRHLAGRRVCHRGQGLQLRRREDEDQESQLGKVGHAASVHHGLRG